MPIPFTQAPVAPAPHQGQQVDVGGQIGRGFQTGQMIGESINNMRRKRDERRRQREIDRAFSNFDVNDPSEESVQRLASLVGPEATSQWLNLAAQLEGREEKEREGDLKKLRDQSDFNMGLYAGMEQVPPEQRAEWLVSQLQTKSQSGNPVEVEQARNFYTSITGDPDLSDEGLKRKWEMDGVLGRGAEIYDNRAKVKAELDELDTRLSAEAEIESAKRALDLHKQQMSIESDERQTSARIAADISQGNADREAANQRHASGLAAQGGGAGIPVSERMLGYEQMLEEMGEDTIVPMDLYAIEEGLMETREVVDEDGNSREVPWNPLTGKEVDLGRFAQRELDPNDPMSQLNPNEEGGVGSTLRRWDLMRNSGI